MNETNAAPPAPDDNPDTNCAPDVCAELGALPAGAIVTVDALARMFRRHPESIRRAIARGELPAPAKMLGSKCWTASAVLKHFEKRLEEAAKEQERKQRTLTERAA